MTAHEILSKEVDEIASECCRRMSSEETDDFFSYQKQRRDSGQGYNSKLNKQRVKKDDTGNVVMDEKGDPVIIDPIGKYYKGKYRGEKKEVFEVDGKKFNCLWEKLNAYAARAASRSHMVRNYEDEIVQEDVMDIRFQTFFVLRFYGATPNGASFSQIFPLIVNNILTTSARKRFRCDRTKINSRNAYYTENATTNKLSSTRKEELKEFLKYKVYEDVHNEFFPEYICKNGKESIKFFNVWVIFGNTSGYEYCIYNDEGISDRWVEDINEYRHKSMHTNRTVGLADEHSRSNDDDEGLSICETISDNKVNTPQEIEFWSNIPKELKKSVYLAINGVKINEIAKMTDQDSKKLKRILQEEALETAYELNNKVFTFYADEVIKKCKNKKRKKSLMRIKNSSTCV